MKVWLYARLSRDEDSELNSLTNQQNILRKYAEKNHYTVVGESFDDNVSGMHFNREGINKIYSAVEEKQIDAVIVKDLSRLGRHRTQTAMFIDYLRENIQSMKDAVLEDGIPLMGYTSWAVSILFQQELEK